MFKNAPLLLTSFALAALVACVPEGDAYEYTQTVGFDARTGSIDHSNGTDKSGPELNSDVILISGLDDIVTTRDPIGMLPEPPTGVVHHVKVDSHDLAFFLDAVDRWVEPDRGVLAAASSDGTSMEWPIE